jgi:hypothetical protein
MSKATQSFHPQVIIVDHFDEIINQIDIKTETLLLDQSLSHKAQNKLNEIRATKIKKIEELKELNLSRLPQKFNEEEYSGKWSHFLDDESLEYKLKIVKIKEEIILYDCVLLGNPSHLWITSWFHNETNLGFLK